MTQFVQFLVDGLTLGSVYALLTQSTLPQPVNVRNAIARMGMPSRDAIRAASLREHGRL
jgi:hypothetical protein